MTNLKQVFAAVFVLSAVLLLGAEGDAQTYGGRATGVTATVNNGNPVNSIFADTGQLPFNGGNVSISAPSAFVSGLLVTGVLTASTSGALRSSQSVTIVNDVDVSVGGVRIRANRVTANSGCICCPGAGDGTCGGSTIFNGLTITDQAGVTSNVSVTGQPNQVVDLPNGIGTLTLNQQTTGTTAITVNGLRIDGLVNGTVYTVLVASATSSIECLVLSPTAAGVTVSGRVLTSSLRPISGATVSLTESSGTIRTARTNTLGYYSFAEVEVARTHVLQASYRTYSFPAQAFIAEDNTRIDLIAN
jgi:hypothetical protein